MTSTLGTARLPAHFLNLHMSQIVEKKWQLCLADMQVGGSSLLCMGREGKMGNL